MEKKYDFYNEKTVNKILDSIDMDEFDDYDQNKATKDYFYMDRPNLKAFFERNVFGDKILDVGCGCGDSLIANPKIKYAIDPCPKRVERAIELAPKDCVIKKAFAENIPFEDEFFDLIICWGTFYFTRSVNETIIEFNRVLKKGGRIVMDVMEETIFPITLVLNNNHFVHYYLPTFGFHLIEKTTWVENKGLKKTAFVLEKYRDFEPNDLLLPQSKGEIKNFDPNKHWWLK